MQVSRDTVHVKTLLTQTRKSRGLSLDQVAAAVKTDPTNLSRVEKGMQIPKRELARALYVLYQGVVPLGVIYDPEWDAAKALLRAEQARKRKERAAERARQRRASRSLAMPTCTCGVVGPQAAHAEVCPIRSVKAPQFARKRNAACVT